MKKTINSKLLKVVLILSTLFVSLPSYSLFSDSKVDSFTINVEFPDEPNNPSDGKFISCKFIDTGEICEVDIEIGNSWQINNNTALAVHYEKITIIGIDENNQRPWEVTLNYNAPDSPFENPNGYIFVGTWNAYVEPQNDCVSRTFTVTSYHWWGNNIEGSFSFQTFSGVPANPSFHDQAICPAINP